MNPNKLRCQTGRQTPNVSTLKIKLKALGLVDEARKRCTKLEKEKERATTETKFKMRTYTKIKAFKTFALDSPIKLPMIYM